MKEFMRLLISALFILAYLAIHIGLYNLLTFLSNHRIFPIEYATRQILAGCSALLAILMSLEYK